MAFSCQSLGSKQKIFLAIALLNMVILVIYQGFFSQVFSAFEGSVSPPNQDAIRSFVISGSKQGSLSDHDDIDIHYHNPDLGHTGQTSNGHVHNHTGDWTKTVAIGGGITSKGVAGASAANIATKFQFFYTLLPTFCKTASASYHYHFYLAYDKTDGFFNNINNLKAFTKVFQDRTDKLCRTVKTSLHLVQCTHNARPAWAQNDAMFEAYIDDIEYYYRVNDDSDLSSGGWTEAFISTLAAYKPKNVGVVGPKHRGGNEAILTYDFVHKTHVDIFGFYYPRLFTDWWADDWVTKVYQPGRSTKLPTIKLVHTMKLGQRYKLLSSATGGKLAGQLTVDKLTLQRYIKYADAKEKGQLPKADGSKVISMSLYGQDPLYTYGAIRNAQILPVHFPDWALRIYVAGPNASSELIVPERILLKLRALGAHIAVVNIKEAKIPPKFWRYFVADDETVDKFLIRDVDARLSDREYEAIQLWEHSNASFHCIKDHPKHASAPVVDGLWGAKSKNLKKILRFSMKDGLSKNLNGLHNVLNISSKGEATLLKDVIWPLVETYAICHDSVSCDKWPQSRPFPLARTTKGYIGQRFDSLMNPVDTDTSELDKVTKERCTGKWTGKNEFPPLTDLHVHANLKTNTYIQPKTEISIENKTISNTQHSAVQHTNMTLSDTEVANQAVKSNMTAKETRKQATEKDTPLDKPKEAPLVDINHLPSNNLTTAGENTLDAVSLSSKNDTKATSNKVTR